MEVLTLVNKEPIGFRIFNKSDFSLEELKNIKGCVRIEIDADYIGKDTYTVYGGSRTAVERIAKYRKDKIGY